MYKSYHRTRVFFVIKQDLEVYKEHPLSVKMTTKRSGGEVEFNHAPNNFIILVKPSVMGPIQLSCFKFFGEKNPQHVHCQKVGEREGIA